MPKVVIDPGHGGVDPGAVGPGRVKEKDVNLLVSKKVAEILSPLADVRLTRSGDLAPGDELNELWVRAQIANNWGAECFVSIHCNSAASPQAHGTETHYYTGSSLGKQLASAIQKRLLINTGLTDRGIKEANFSVLRNTKCTAALVEMAFISNPTEESYLKSSQFQDKTARAIAEGIAEFLALEVPQDEKVKIKVEGLVLEGITIGDLTYVPVRALAEALGKTVEWDEKNKIVNIA